MGGSCTKAAAGAVRSDSVVKRGPSSAASTYAATEVSAAAEQAPIPKPVATVEPAIAAEQTPSQAGAGQWVLKEEETPVEAASAGSPSPGASPRESGSPKPSEIAAAISARTASPVHTPTPDAVGTPVQDVDGVAWVEEDPVGLYLVYLVKDNGTFMSVWSKTYVPDALAFVRPSKYFRVPEYKFKKPMPVQARVDMGRKMYFQAWTQFVKAGKACNGELVLLPDLNKLANVSPLALWYHMGEKATKQVVGTGAVNLKFADAVTAMSPVYDGFVNWNKHRICTRQKFFEISRASGDSHSMNFEQ